MLIFRRYKTSWTLSIYRYGLIWTAPVLGSFKEEESYGKPSRLEINFTYVSGLTIIVRPFNALVLKNWQNLVEKFARFHH